MPKKMSHCLLCGNEYEVCRLCQNTIENNPWRLSCDSPRHFQIYMTVLSIRDNTLSQSQAKEMLDRIKVTADEIKTFVPSVQDTLLPLYEKAERKVGKTVKTDKAKHATKEQAKTTSEPEQKEQSESEDNKIE